MYIYMPECGKVWFDYISIYLILSVVKITTTITAIYKHLNTTKYFSKFAVSECVYVGITNLPQPCNPTNYNCRKQEQQKRGMTMKDLLKIQTCNKTGISRDVILQYKHAIGN